jgi:23S rRNA (cytosine1962-C5)-methyltransferase
MLELRLKPGREKSVLRGHPWIFSGSVASSSAVKVVEFPGQTVRITDSNGKFLAWGAISPESKIRVRVWSLDESEVIGADYFLQRITAAVNHRKQLAQNKDVNAYRLVHGESDGLPGLIVDKYGQTLVVQFLTNGVEFWRETIIDQLGTITSCDQIFERSDADVRHLEGLTPQKGNLKGGEAGGPVEICEGKLRYWVDITHGQKTGFFIDQRENRAIVRELTSEKSVLDCFAYTGGFTIAAVKGGAKKVTALESSMGAIKLGRENLKLNQIPADFVEWLETDVFKELRKFRDRNRKYDLIILDPPKFAPTAAHAQKAARGYKDINLLAFKLLNPGGLLVTFSCSGGVSSELFQKIVAGAALDAGIEGKIIRRLGPGIDHPVALNFPEGEYLKGFIIQL